MALPTALTLAQSGLANLRLGVACSVLSLLLPLPSWAQPFDWRPANFEIAQLLKQGRYDDALPLIEQTARRCPAAVNAVEAGICSAILSENRSEILEHRGDLAGAEAGLRTMIAERSRVLPATDKLVVQAWLFLVSFLGRHGRTADQEAAVAAAEHLALADPAQAQDALNLMHTRANLLFRLDRPAASIELFRRAITFARATPGVVMPPALELDLAGALSVNGDYDALIALTSEMLASARAQPLDPVARLRAAAILGAAVNGPEQARAALPLLEAARASETVAVDMNVRLAFLNGLAAATVLSDDPAKGLSLAQEVQRLAERSDGLHGKLLFPTRAGTGRCAKPSRSAR